MRLGPWSSRLAAICIGGLLAVVTACVGVDGADDRPGGQAIGSSEPATGGTRILDKPIRVGDRWLISPSAQQPHPEEEPRLHAAVEVLQTFFGSADAEETMAVSAGAARDFALFMVMMQRLTGAHPMEPVTVWESFEIVADDEHGLVVAGKLSEDRATGSGLVDRTIFEEFRFVENDQGELHIASFTRNNRSVVLDVVSGDQLGRASQLVEGVTLHAVQRSTNGSLYIAGELYAPPGGESAALLAEELRLLTPEPLRPLFVDQEIASDGLSRYFFLSFPAEGATGPATLELWLEARGHRWSTKMDLPTLPGSTLGEGTHTRRPEYV